MTRPLKERHVSEFMTDPIQCPHCGPNCLKGAAHNARVEDGVIWKPIPSVSPASEKWDVRDGKELVMTTEIPCEWYGRKVGMFHACVDTSDGSLRCINCKNEFHKPLSPASTKEEK